ncbi:hypothetical protein D320_20774, partial [Haloferax sp. BAB-2207]
ASEGPAGQPADAPTDADGTVIEPSSDERPDLDQLREELNDQFESIKIVNPGQYELNLMELYDRSEYIISLREDGRYVIEVPDTWAPATARTERAFRARPTFHPVVSGGTPTVRPRTHESIRRIGITVIYDS